MSEGRDPQEFRRYRQVLIALYVAALAFGALLLFASVVFELFLKKPERRPSPTEIDRNVCIQEVEDLLDELADEAADLHRVVKRSPSPDVGERWEAFVRDWRGRWQALDRECHFTELAETGLGAAYDRTAWVHRNLLTLELKYRANLKRFAREVVSEQAAMRKALKRSRELLGRETNEATEGTGR